MLCTKKYLLASLLLLASVINGVGKRQIEMARVDQDSICQHSSSISTQLKLAMLGRYVLVASVAAGASYLGYKWYNGSPEVKPSISKKEALEILNENKKLIALMPWLQKVSEQQGAKKEAVGWLTSIRENTVWFTTEVAKNAAAIYLLTNVQALMGRLEKYVTALDTASDKMLAKIFFTPTIEWYISTHTKLRDTFITLEQHVACIEKKIFKERQQRNSPTSIIFSSGETLLEAAEETPLTDEQWMGHIDGLRDTWSIAIGEWQKALGFISLKETELQKSSEAKSARLGTIKKVIHRTLDDFARISESLLNDTLKSKTVPDGLGKKFSELRTILEGQLQECVVIEMSAT